MENLLSKDIFTRFQSKLTALLSIKLQELKLLPYSGSSVDKNVKDVKMDKTSYTYVWQQLLEEDANSVNVYALNRSPSATVDLHKNL